MTAAVASRAWEHRFLPTLRHAGQHCRRRSGAAIGSPGLLPSELPSQHKPQLFHIPLNVVFHESESSGTPGTPLLPAQ